MEKPRAKGHPRHIVTNDEVEEHIPLEIDEHTKLLKVAIATAIQAAVDDLFLQTCSESKQPIPTIHVPRLGKDVKDVKVPGRFAATPGVFEDMRLPPPLPRDNLAIETLNKTLMRLLGKKYDLKTGCPIPLANNSDAAPVFACDYSPDDDALTLRRIENLVGLPITTWNEWQTLLLSERDARQAAYSCEPCAQYYVWDSYSCLGPSARLFLKPALEASFRLIAVPALNDSETIADLMERIANRIHKTTKATKRTEI